MDQEPGLEDRNCQLTLTERLSALKMENRCYTSCFSGRRSIGIPETLEELA